MNLIDDLIKDGWLKTPEIIEAFRRIKRKDFMPPDKENLSELNEALPIGWGQTISQPLTVAFMIELLQPKLGDRVLDIGSGSGWTTALLAYIVSEKGNSKSEIRNPNDKDAKVIAIEIIPELKEFGEKNVSKYNYIDKGIVEFICADGSKGYKGEAPFDRILCSAEVQNSTRPKLIEENSPYQNSEAEKLPEEWKKQLKINGRIVAPIGHSIWLFIKKSEQEFISKEYPGFVFVPLVSGV